MFNRIDLKEQAKVSFRANYWKCVLVSLILGLIGGGAGYSFNVSFNRQEFQYTGSFDWTLLLPMLTWIVGMGFVIIVIAVVISVCVINPLKVGCLYFARNNAGAPATLEDLGVGFKSYSPAVKTMFFTDLYIFLWSLLLVIPGIVKSYSYRMVPYLIADHPELSTREILDLSRAMMQGNKWEAFVLDLSFIGWNILTCLTLGLVGIFYAGPYQMQTNANLYLALCETGRSEF